MTNQPRQISPTKRKAKPTGKRTGGRPTQKLQTTRRMSLRTDETIEKLPNNNTREKPASSNSEDNQSTTSLETNTSHNHSITTQLNTKLPVNRIREPCADQRNK